MKKKPTDSELIKALKYCVKDDVDCESCPVNQYCEDTGKMVAAVLDLINRKDKKIKELIKENDCLKSTVKTLEITEGLRNNRKYYKQFVDTVFSKTHGELAEPDFDYIYQLYFEQQDKIEKLVKLIDASEENIKTATRVINEWEKRYAFIKSEVIKEFIDKFEKRCIAGGIYPAFVKRQAENTKKEMLGETDV